VHLNHHLCCVAVARGASGGAGNRVLKIASAEKLSAPMLLFQATLFRQHYSERRFVTFDDANTRHRDNCVQDRFDRSQQLKVGVQVLSRGLDILVSPDLSSSRSKEAPNG